MRSLKTLSFIVLNACGGAQKTHNFQAEVPRCAGSVFTIIKTTQTDTAETAFCSEPPDPIKTCQAVREYTGIDLSYYFNLDANCAEHSPHTDTQKPPTEQNRQ